MSIMNDDKIITDENNIPSAIVTQENEYMTGISKISDEVVGQMNKLSMITKHDIARLKEAESFLLSTYTDVRKYRPLITKLTSVLNNKNFPTVDSKYWQCKNEAEVHFNELKRSLYKYDKASVDVEEMTFKIAEMESILDKNGVNSFGQAIDINALGFDLRRMNIKKESHVFELKQMEKDLKYRIEEVTDWHKIADHLEDHCQFDCKDPDAHFADRHFKVLAMQINEAKDDESRSIYIAQLKTFSDILGKAENKK